ncbi:MAG: GLUG motif-containing protein [Candidatus Pacearchaeota archaeon]
MKYFLSKINFEKELKIKGSELASLNSINKKDNKDNILFSGGSGTIEDPYKISNCLELQNINYNLDANYVLIQDIDCSETKNWNNGKGFEPIGSYNNSFKGNFYGRNYKIIGLFVNKSSFYSGLFGYINNSVITDVILVNPEIIENWYAGSLVGYSYKGIIINSHVRGGNVIAVRALGGLVGANSGSIINSSVENVNVFSYVLYVGGYVCSTAGGLAGSSSGEIISSYSISNVSCGGSNSFSIGGLVGSASGSIINSYSKGDVRGYYQVGGLVGSSGNLRIINSYSSGNIYNFIQSESGGLVGFVDGNITIINSFSTASLNSNKARGLVGWIMALKKIEIINSYWNNHSNSLAYYCWSNQTNNYNDGCVAIQNNEQYFYYINNPPLESWNFNSIWDDKNDKENFPVLKWQENFVDFCNKNGFCDNGESCSLCPSECVCSLNSPDCVPTHIRADIKGCTCIPKWVCTNWSECINSKKERICKDIKNCGINDGKPAENISCGCENIGICIDTNYNNNVEDEEILCAINKWINSNK